MMNSQENTEPNHHGICTMAYIGLGSGTRFRRHHTTKLPLPDIALLADILL